MLPHGLRQVTLGRVNVIFITFMMLVARRVFHTLLLLNVTLNVLEFLLEGCK